MNSAELSEKRWLTTFEVKEIYGIAINTQAKYRMKGIIPYVKINRIIRYDRMLLDAWLEAHTVPTITEIKNASC
ncbi:MULTISPECIES: helix-turn-helix domain-containing protein [unclassified Campylobacter]|uniref:helix-turn-helix domain-containing protein n=1 Tax=Campylobacter TaxID=194 RepID=UPI00147283FF|nr:MULTISPECIES: helix-turn-helix domain-containing protein [unclassified Campylobacter]MBE3606345.1 helix-turn-helix domain-containing protein [Campylobacter sp. RM13119]